MVVVSQGHGVFITSGICVLRVVCLFERGEFSNGDLTKKSLVFVRVCVCVCEPFLTWF